MATVNPAAGQQPATRRKQSGIGIASFIISLLVGFGVVVMLIVTLVMKTDRGTLNSDGATIFTTVFLIVGLFLLLAFALGVGSLFSKTRSKLFGIMAIVLQLGIVILSIITLALAFIR